MVNVIPGHVNLFVGLLLMVLDPSVSFTSATRSSSSSVIPPQLGASPHLTHGNNDHPSGKDTDIHPPPSHGHHHPRRYPDIPPPTASHQEEDDDAFLNELNAITLGGNLHDELNHDAYATAIAKDVLAHFDESKINYMTMSQNPSAFAHLAFQNARASFFQEAMDVSGLPAETISNAMGELDEDLDLIEAEFQAEIAQAISTDIKGAASILSSRESAVHPSAASSVSPTTDPSSPASVIKEDNGDGSGDGKIADLNSLLDAQAHAKLVGSALQRQLIERPDCVIKKRLTKESYRKEILEVMPEDSDGLSAGVTFTELFLSPEYLAAEYQTLTGNLPSAEVKKHWMATYQQFLSFNRQLVSSQSHVDLKLFDRAFEQLLKKYPRLKAILDRSMCAPEYRVFLQDLFSKNPLYVIPPLEHLVFGDYVIDFFPAHYLDMNLQYGLEALNDQYDIRKMTKDFIRRHREAPPGELVAYWKHYKIELSSFEERLRALFRMIPGGKRRQFMQILKKYSPEYYRDFLGDDAVMEQLASVFVGEGGEANLIFTLRVIRTGFILRKYEQVCQKKTASFFKKMDEVIKVSSPVIRQTGQNLYSMYRTAKKSALARATGAQLKLMYHMGSQYVRSWYLALPPLPEQPRPSQRGRASDPSKLD